MQTTSLQRELQRLSDDIEVPNHEERDHHRFPEHLIVDDPDFDALVRELWKASRPPQDSTAKVHRDYLRSILLNLARGALTRQWTIFSGNSNAYSKGGLMHTLGFTSRRRVGAILELLEGRGWLLKVVGKKYEKQGQANLYWATDELRKRLITPLEKRPTESPMRTAKQSMVHLRRSIRVFSYSAKGSTSA